MALTRCFSEVNRSEIFEFGKMLRNELETHVGRNLVFMNERWFSSEMTSINSQLKLTPLNDLSHHNLLQLKN